MSSSGSVVGWILLQGDMFRMPDSDSEIAAARDKGLEFYNKIRQMDLDV